MTPSVSVVMGHARVLATRGSAGACWGAACARQPVCADSRWVPAGPPASSVPCVAVRQMGRPLFASARLSAQAQSAGPW